MKIGWPHPRGRAGHRVIGIWTICVSLLQPQHRVVKSVYTPNNIFVSHVILSPDSDRDSVMIVIVMSLSDVPISSQTLAHKPDTNTRVSPLWWWWVSQVMLVRVSPVQMETFLMRKGEKGIRFLSLFTSIGMSWSVDKSYGPNTTNTFLRLSPAVHFYWYLAINQSTLRPLKNYI